MNESLRNAAKAAQKARRNGPQEHGAHEHIDPDTGEVTVLHDDADAAPADAAPADTLTRAEDQEFYAVEVTEEHIVRQVTLPVLKFPAGAAIYVKILDSMRKGKDLKEKSNGRYKMEPATICTVAGPRGAKRVLICGAVLESELRDNYPDDAYVGRWFAIKKFAPDAGRDQNYATYQVIEISDPTRPAPTQIAAQ